LKLMGDDRPLQGRLAIVTGASRGIGAAIAERLASGGAEVVVAARTVSAPPGVESADETVERILSRGGKATALPLDLERADSREALIEETVARFGRLDILVNNAGTAAYEPTDEMALATARSQIDTYFLGPWHLCHLALPHMKRAGRGWILQVGSCAVAAPEPPYDAYNAARGYETLYAAAKAAAHRLATGLAAEVYDDNIAVNVVAPVLAVYTPGLAALNLGLTPDHPIMEPVEDIAEAALDMLSREPADYTGQVEFSHQFLDRIGRSTRSLDGARVIKARPRSEAAHAG
jgi:NAD(P)-dependent dehydrogenase (short-subunit alcohol dehydrogenase family)